MFALVVRFDLRDEKSAARFDALTRQVIDKIRTLEPGTLVYATHTVRGDPLARVFYEVYADADAKRAHEDAEHVKSFHAAKDPLVAARRVEYLVPGEVTGLSI
jgi:quinol monooxygenase YgiN